MNALTVSAATFDSTVLASPVPVLVDFWAPWCGPCKAVAPTLDAIAREQAGALVVAKVNVDEEPDLAARYGVRAIPTLLVFSGGELRDTLVGLAAKETILARLRPLLTAPATR